MIGTVVQLRHPEIRVILQTVILNLYECHCESVGVKVLISFFTLGFGHSMVEAFQAVMYYVH